MRKIFIATLPLALAVSLTACAPGTPASNCTPLAAEGDATKAVTVKGETFSAPDTTFPTPLKAATTETTFIGGDTKDLALPSDSVAVEATLYNGDTGKILTQTGYDGKQLPLIDLSSQSLPSLTQALTCAPVGSRVVSVLAGDEQLAANLGVDPQTSIVAVFDVKKTYLGKADGTPQVVPDGFPAVVLDSNGVPGVTIPPSAPPTTTQVALLKKGNGAVVKDGQTVTVQYAGYLWADNTLFQSTWESNQPASFDVNKVVPGFKKGLVGQTVGSQVLIVIPPADGYGDQAQGSIPAGSTLVFVVDILGVD